MRRLIPLLLLGLATITLTSQARAQVITDDHALDALQPTPAPPTAPPTAAGRKPAPPLLHRRTTPRHPSPAKKSALPPNVPAAPPANPVIAPPPFIMPTRKPPPPPPISLRQDAVGTVQNLPQGVRITFGPDSADLNPATLAAIRLVAGYAHLDPVGVVAITAYAPGTPDDPSTPRRISLDRALSVRAALLAAGIPSERIRALPSGFINIGTDAPDRADVTLITPPARK